MCAGSCRDRHEVNEAIAEGLQPLNVAGDGVEREMRGDADEKGAPESMPTKERHHRSPEQWDMRPVAMVVHACVVDEIEPEHVDVGKERADHARHHERALRRAPEQARREVAGGCVREEHERATANVMRGFRSVGRALAARSKRERW